MKMQRELAEHICDLINELRDIESMRHGIYKAMLPKEIIADTIMGKDWPCAFVMRWDENRHLWVTAYETLPRPLDVGNANELIDALYNLLIWAINEKHIEL